MSTQTSDLYGAPDGLIVVGGGPSGHSAAAAYRQAGGDGRVVIISADGDRPYQRPPLSKDFLRGESEMDELPLESPEFYRDNGIELQLADPVTSLDLGRRTVRTVSDRRVGYENCVLATGCRPAQLPVPGADHPKVLRLRSFAEAKTLRAAAEGAGSAIVIGSGFIGCEAAVSLAARGVDVTMLSTQELPQLERLGRPAAGRIAGWLAEAGVRLISGAEVTEIRDGDTVRAGADSYRADLILSAAGVVPNSELARGAGLLIQQGRIVVDEHLATRSARVYAAGDVALAHNAAAGRSLPVEHWGEALKMGEIAGRNAAGSDEVSWDDVPGFWSGIGERTLKYSAWGDGYDHAELVDHPGGGFTVWYSTDGATVGVLTHRADDDYELGSTLIAKGARPPHPTDARSADLHR